MKVLVIDKTAGLASSHERHQALASREDVELSVLGPRHWVENGRDVDWQPRSDCLYTAYPGEVCGKDRYARVVYYRGICRAFARSQPEIIQLLEEPWSLTALQTVLASAIFAPTAKIVFYTWENIYRPWVYPSRISCLYAKIDKMMHTLSSAAVTATDGARDVLLDKGYKQPVRVIPYGIPAGFHASRELAAQDDRPFTIGYIGRFMHMKGLDLLLDALTKLPECRLLLVGGGEDESAYRVQADRKNIADRIEWIPPLSENRVPDALRRMDVLVLPSRRVEGWMEQLGRVLIEAMAVGVPVIGSSSGAIPEVIGDAGLVFQENSVADLVEKIHYLQARPEERERFIALGKEWVSTRYTWDRFAQALCQLYREIQ
jgi:glycosyltransferase involved in cell wall biosynthesis